MSTEHNSATIFTHIRVAQRERQNRPHYLEQLDGPEAPRRIELKKPELVLGRAEDADIRLGSGRASRQHAVIQRRNEDYTICDKDSRNGIFLNGVKIHSAVLRDADIIQVADCVFTYHEA